jgi:hypothetical protein
MRWKSPRAPTNANRAFVAPTSASSDGVNRRFGDATIDSF